LRNFGDKPEKREMYCHDCEMWVSPWVPFGIDNYAGHTGYVCTRCNAGLGADRVLIVPRQPVVKTRN
jgi:hypothetical protein